MPQVNRIKKVCQTIFLTSSLFLLTSCSSKNEVTREDYITQKTFDNINKDAIFEAAKKVFIYSGDKSFIIDSYRNNLEVIKPKMIHRPFVAYTIEDKWNLSIEEKDSKSFAKLDVSRIVDYDENNIVYLDKDVHELFWNRVEYLLGLNKDWYSCFKYKIKFNMDNALCDNIDLKNVITPSENDVLKNISFEDRKEIKFVKDFENDILKEDIDLKVEDNEEKPDLLNITNPKIEEKVDEKLDILDEEIKNLNKQVNENIDETLQKIKKIENTENNQ